MLLDRDTAAVESPTVSSLQPAPSAGIEGPRANGGLHFAPLACVDARVTISAPLAIAIAITIAVSASACAAQAIPLEMLPLPAAPDPGALRVEGSVSGGTDPLPIQGTGMRYDGVSRALERTVAAAAAGWVQRNTPRRPGGWELALELVRSRAVASTSEVAVELEVRATLRGIAGRVYLAQTSVHVKETGSAEQPDEVAKDCLEHLAQDIAGWLEGVQP
jgi:hypothetical protein